MGAGQDDIYTVPGQVNYIVAKGYHHNNLLSFMQETMKKVVATNIRDKILGHFPISITVRLCTRDVHGNRYATCDYTYTGSSGKPAVTHEIS